MCQVSLPATEQVYAARLDAELDDLARAEGDLTAARLQETLSDSVSRDIRVLIHDVRRTLELQRSVVDWTGLHDARARARQVRTELFCLVQTALFRDEGYDEAILDAAELLVAHLQARSRIRRPVLLAVAPDSESMDHTLSMLLLRFPGASVWDLPVLGHEFGHHAVEHLESGSDAARGSRPLLELVLREVEDTVESADCKRAWPHELAADVVATYALGVSYPLACLALRVDLAQPSAGTDTHPSWDQRIEIMAATLEKISALLGTGKHAAAAAEVVRPLWRQLSAGTIPRAARAIELGLLAEKLVGELHRHTEGLLYDDAGRAVPLGQLLDAPEQPADLTDATVPTVLDAVWRWRRTHWDAGPDELRRAQGIALTWCREIRGRPEGG
jgi:hypothetical protein